MVAGLAELGNAPVPVQGWREPPARGTMQWLEIARREQPGAPAQVAAASMLARSASGPRVGMPSPYSIGMSSMRSAVAGRMVTERREAALRNGGGLRACEAGCNTRFAVQF